MKCPSCGNRGKPDSRPDPGVPAAFEFRGRLGGKVIVRCLQCNRGVFVKIVPPGYKAIPSEQWVTLDEFWQMRRVEILADLQAFVEYEGVERPQEEVVAESQVSFVGQTQGRTTLIQAMRVAGYESADRWSGLMHNNLAEFARIAAFGRQQNVIHDEYESILAQGGASQTEAAAARIAAATDALAGGEEGIRAFLSSGRS